MFKLGIEHILTGYDHLLFLFALLLGCRRFKPMLWVVTGFTVAHSLTLVLAALNLANISPSIVEPLIAASIAIVAVENFRRGEVRWERYALTCGFGLIHGFGFASALRETGLAHGGAELARDLFAFNLGVETGQLAVAAVVVPILFLLRQWGWFARSGAKWLSTAVIFLACYWFVQRVFPAWF
jgi:hydrogenase/urease accessory protein HupE